MIYKDSIGRIQAPRSTTVFEIVQVICGEPFLALSGLISETRERESAQREQEGERVREWKSEGVRELGSEWKR